jgi:dihydroorotase
MSLYLHEDITPEVIREAKKAGITGVKSYPAGVTTVRANLLLDCERRKQRNEKKEEKGYML